MTDTNTQKPAKKETLTKSDLLEIVNSQALTIRAIMELLNLTEQQVREKGLEIIKKLSMSAGPYDDEDGFYDDEEDEDYDEDYDENDFDHDDDDEDDDDDFGGDFDDSDEGLLGDDDDYSFKQQESLKSKIGISGVSNHPAGAVFFGG